MYSQKDQIPISVFNVVFVQPAVELGIQRYRSAFSLAVAKRLTLQWHIYFQHLRALYMSRLCPTSF